MRRSRSASWRRPTVATRGSSIGLTGLINDVYEVARAGLWRDGAARTTASEVAELIRAEQIAVAALQGQIVGSIRGSRRRG